jgi:ferredoxin
MSSISRRDWFRSAFGRRTEPKTAGAETIAARHLAPSPPPDDAPQLALILDRFCLAWQGSFCSVCSERCPEPGAIALTHGKPRVNPDLCTGCKICHDVCPAPKNAVFLVARKPRQGMIASITEPPTAP